MLQIVLGILGSLITNWFSRQREFRADHGGAMLAGREQMIGGAPPARGQSRARRHAAPGTRDDEDQRRPQLGGVVLHSPAARRANRRARELADTDWLSVPWYIARIDITISTVLPTRFHDISRPVCATGG